MRCVLLVHALALCGVTLLTYIATVRVDYIGTRLYTDKLVLDDVTFHYLPEVSFAYVGIVADLLVLLPVLALLVRDAWVHNSSAIGHYLSTLTLVHLCRTITMSVTVLPSPSCRPASTFTGIGGCHDLIFSGHIATACTTVFYLIVYHDSSCVWLGEVAVLAVCLLATRAHYTIDVLMAISTSYAIFALRHRDSALATLYMRMRETVCEA